MAKAKQAKQAKRVADGRMTDTELMEIIDRACTEFEGDATVLESAIGALVFGRLVGWHALRLMHAGRTFKRYEQILGVKFRDVLPDRTDQAGRLRGIRLADNIGKFWQAVTSGLVSAREAAT